MNGFSQNNVTPYLIRGAPIPILSILFIDVKTPPSEVLPWPSPKASVGRLQSHHVTVFPLIVTIFPLIVTISPLIATSFPLIVTISPLIVTSFPLIVTISPLIVTSS